MAKQRKTKQTKARLDKTRFEAEKQLQAIKEAAEKRAAELQKKVEEAEAEALKAEEEEKQLLEDTMKQIKATCDENGYFCGVIITKEVLLQITNMMIDNAGQNIKIPFRLYIDDADEQTEKEPEKDLKIENPKN